MMDVIAWQFGASFWCNRDAIPEAFRHKAIPLCNAETAAAELEALRADAERYRYLLEHHVSPHESDDGTLVLRFVCDFEHYNDVSASIDAARAGGGK